MSRHIRINCILLLLFAWAGNITAATIRDCEVSGVGLFPGGIVFEGAYSDRVGVETINWTHAGEGWTFETTAVAGSDDIVCREDGRITGTILSTGYGSYNGIPGFGYYLYMEDNRPAPDSVLAVASISYYPTTRNSVSVSLDVPKTVVIPSEIPVTTGGSGKGKTRLILNENVTCTYVGTGSSYVFKRCNDSLGSGRYVAGDSIDVSEIRLKIQQADRSFPLTSVELEFGTGPAPGTPDYYQLVILNSDGSEANRFAGSVVTGDISVTLIPEE